MFVSQHLAHSVVAAVMGIALFLSLETAIGQYATALPLLFIVGGGLLIVLHKKIAGKFGDSARARDLLITLGGISLFFGASHYLIPLIGAKAWPIAIVSALGIWYAKEISGVITTKQ